ncbi:hypothetical protein MSP8887_04175 [Marinomonas spartinae]|uniref:DUF6795 domain-containing protein n=1 Tax=Marinomonas spartinae TaxID=1792290 RepID=UPI000808E4F8|nr:DUF6795 domain-containing protein [Marinomonas spartinae]SBS40085.1 hypothetical protein MSP8887_04175 [Marinomonas spartinae]
MSLLNMLRKLGNHIGAYKVHLCPEVKGKISDHGKPLVNVKIERTLSFSDGKYVEDYTFTDENGEFSLPEVNIRSGQPAVPFAEVFTSQAICFSYKNNEYILWASRLSGIKQSEAYVKKLGSLIGDISNDQTLFNFKSDKFGEYTNRANSICIWENDYRIMDVEKYLGLNST